MRKLLYAFAALVVLTITLFVFESFSQENTEECSDMTMMETMPVLSQPAEFTSTDCGQKAHQHLINLSVASDHTYYRTDTVGQECHLYIEVEADDYTPPVEDLRPPVNMSIVIDRSGSMHGDKLKFAKDAAKFVVNMLEETDFISVVMYDESVDVVVPSVPVSNKKEILSKIDRIHEDGATNLCGGMMEGYHQTKKNKSVRFINKVLLLSDGLVNEGITDENTIAEIAKKEDQENGVAISTFGIGLDFNEKLMTQLAEKGSGNYYFIAQADQISNIFDRELSGILKVVAQNTYITVDIPAGVHLSKAYGGNYILDGEQLKVNLRDIYSNETKAILFKFNIDEGYSQPIAFNTTLHYDDAVLKTPAQKLSIYHPVLPTQNRQQFEASHVACVTQQAALYRMNERLEEAMKATEDGDYMRVQGLVSANQMDLLSVSDQCGSSIELMRMDSLNQNYGNKAKEYEAMPETEKKFMMKSSREANYKMRNKK
jgi:Ca-activated chloride channel family protein